MGASDRAARGGSASGAWWALLDAQARRVRVVGIAVPLATAALVAIAGSCWALAAGPASAALAMLGMGLIACKVASLLRCPPVYDSLKERIRL